jgi:hypothetical protein
MHPGYEIPAVAFRAHIKCLAYVYHFALDPNKNEYLRFDRCQPIHFEVSIGAEHTPARDIYFSIDPAEMEIMADRVVGSRQPFHAERRF